MNDLKVNNAIDSIENFISNNPEKEFITAGEISVELKEFAVIDLSLALMYMRNQGRLIGAYLINGKEYDSTYKIPEDVSEIDIIPIFKPVGLDT